MEISDFTIEQAREDSANLKKQKGHNNPSTIEMSHDRDIIGSIAQNIVFEYFDQEGLYIAKTSFFDKAIHRDACDFEHRGLNDVKGSPTRNGYNKIYPSTSFLLSDHQRDKKVDWYTFVRLDMENREAHIAGVIAYYDFLEYSKPMESPNLKSPCHYIETKYLKPFRDYVFGV